MSTDFLAPVAISLEVGVLATLLSAPIATGLGAWLARTRSHWRPVVSTVMEFKAFASGRFSVHAHEGQARGGSSTHAHGRSVLLRLEVHPQ